MIEKQVKLTGALWLYTAAEVGDVMTDTVERRHVKLIVGNEAEVAADIDMQVDLVVTLLCDGLLYKLDMSMMALGEAQEISDDLITSGDLKAYFTSDGSITSVLSRTRPYAVAHSQLLGSPPDVYDDED